MSTLTESFTHYPNMQSKEPWSDAHIEASKLALQTLLKRVPQSNYRLNKDIFSQNAYSDASYQFREGRISGTIEGCYAAIAPEAELISMKDLEKLSTMVHIELSAIIAKEREWSLNSDHNYE